MKQASILICVLIFCLSALSAEMVKVSGENNSVQVISSSASETILQFNVSQFSQEKVVIDGSDWYHINLPKEGITQDKGFPQLPVFNRSIVIDDQARMQLEVYDVRYQDIALKVAPSKGIITRDIDPSTVPYTFDKVYLGKDFYPSELAELSEPYILRDFRGITVRTVPFAYNPQTQTLRIYTSYKVRIYLDGTDVRNVFTNERTSITREFMPIYENHFVNWNTYRYTPVSDAFGKLLVICHTNYMSTILPYVNWKKQKGIETELIEWSTIGTTAAQLQTYIQNRYNADNTIAYIQIVGDAPQIPSLSSGGGGSDPSFSLVAGGDNYPDIFIGRFSAENAAQVTAQIDKAIIYERDLNTTANWLNNAMGIASAEGGGSLGDMGESDIQHMNLIRTDLLGYGYTTVDQIYDPGASASTVTTNVNAGRGFINYVGHGSDTAWSTTGFNNTNATNLTNGNKTPFIMDVACVNGNFVSITCFAEAWLRNANGGAVAMYASSINQSWNSPMRAQDECTDLLIAESKTTTGGLYYNSSCKMMDIYGNTTGSDGVNMFKTWHIFGDASLVVRSKTPLAMSVTHPSTIVIGATSVNVSTGVANALVAITYNNTIYGRGFTDGSGNATITLTSPPPSAITYTITATAFNRVTYVGSIQQIAGTGPFMTVSATTYADSNNTPEYNETGRFNVTFNNIGAAAATNVTAVLTCSTPGITITDNTETIASLAAGANTTINNAYYFNIANNVANGTIANFTITMTMAGQDPWIHNFSLTLNAPALSFGNMAISDPSGNNNGLLDPGETVTITIPLSNTGSAASPSGSTTLTSPTTGITINNSPQSFTAISASGSANISFSVTAASDITNGTAATFIFNATAGAYTANKTTQTTVGVPPTVIIGTGTSATGVSEGCPINIWYKSLHGQSVYTAAELNAAGVFGPINITQIGFYNVSAPTLALPNFIIRMKHTTSTDVSSWQTGTGMTTVYSNSSYMPAIGGYEMLTLSIPFTWNGTDNIVIDTAFGLVATYSSTGTVQYTSVTNGYRYTRNDTSDQTAVFSGGTVSVYRPNVKFTLQGGQTQAPAISVSPASVSESLESGSSSNRIVTVTNTGTANLNWSIQGRELVLSDAPERSIIGSTLTCSASQYTPGATENWTFSVYNASTDSEWLKDVYITFPTGVTVNSATNFVGGSGGDMTPNLTSGNGITINWHGEGSSGWGVVYPAETATATVNVTVNSDFSGNLTMPYQIDGDIYGSEPHTLTGNMILTPSGGTPSTWFSASPTSGTIAAGGNATITIHFDTAGLADGTYNSNLVINSNAVNYPSLSVPLSLTVYTTQNPYPVGPRFVAEWEPAKGAIVRYPLGLPYALLANISASDLLYVIVSTANQSACNTALSSNGVNMANVRYINATTDTYWTRDYGPWTIFESDNSMKIVDFTYNRPRPNDDVIPTVVADYLGIGHYDMPITHTGGNIMTDGMGKAMSTELVLEENTSLTQSQINTMFSNYLGVTEYQLYVDPNNTYIDHIDCWAKLLDVDKVMIRSVPTSHAQYSAIEAVVANWQTKTSSYGTPYRIYRVYTPNNEPYSNAYILNKKIYVPQMGTANDAAALTAYQNAMPGYTVLGYSYSNFESTDAIHCRANTVFDEQMITLQHVPPTSVAADHSVAINVQITHTNALNPAQTFVAWKHSPAADWQYAPLTLSGREGWTASMPTPGYGETLYYWIKGTDVAGKNTTLPLCAGSDPFTLITNVIIDLDAPVVTITRTGLGALLQWNAVANADEYQIYRSLTPYGSYSLLTATSALEYTDSEVQPMAFYFVKAVSNQATRN